MRAQKLYGKMRPGGGVEIGLRLEIQDGQKFACLFVQSMGTGQKPCGTWMNVREAKALEGWLKNFIKEAGNGKP